MVETNERKDLYLVTLNNGRQLIVADEEEEFYMGIGEKKKKIKEHLNEKFGSELVAWIKFFGYAQITRANQFTDRATKRLIKQNKNHEL